MPVLFGLFITRKDIILADSKLTSLTTISSASSVDLLYLAHDPYGTSVSRAISASSLFGYIPAKVSINYSSYDALTVVGSSSNSISMRIQNTYTGAHNWNLCSSGGGPGTVGNFVLWNDSDSAGVLEVGPTGTLWIGGSGDTNLYRNAANELKTDDAFTAVGNFASVSGNLYFRAAGATIYFGNSDDTYDTNLYRDSANSLKTDDALYVTAGFTSWTHIYLYASSAALFFGDGAGGYDVSLFRGAANILRTDDTFSAPSLRVTSDVAGAASSVSFSSTVNESVSSGAGSIKMCGSTARDSTGFLKIYNGTAVRYIPYFTTITG